MSRRVVITGCGAVTPAGSELDELWDNLIGGRCFIGPLPRYRCLDLPGLLGAEVELPPEDRLEPALAGESDRSRCAELLLAAARRAVLDGGADALGARDRTGVVVGTTMGEERQIGDLDERVLRAGAAAIDGGFFECAANHRLGALVAERYGLGGPVVSNTTACSSGNAALAWAYDLVASGAADAVLAGGADTLTRVTYCGFSRMGALSKGVCRPFDKNRDGVAFAEGAAMLLLEDLAHARRRGARAYAELAGYGLSNDAYHLTAPDPNGDGVVRAIRQALETTGTASDSIDYVSAHGTGTPYNDLGEMRAMQTVFGARASAVPISSVKSMIGHTNGAAGAIEAIACALAIARQAIPPTANLVEPEPGFDLDFVPGRGRPARVETVLNLGAGFGGFNVCTVLKRVA
jgi:3-oxoacyl-[acyl-carrier-protein] synthase II